MTFEELECVWKGAYRHELRICMSSSELAGYRRKGCDLCDGYDTSCDRYASIEKKNKKWVRF